MGWSTEEVGDTLPDAPCLCERLKQGTLTPRSEFSLSCLCLPLQQAHCCRPKHFWELWQKKENDIILHMLPATQREESLFFLQGVLWIGSNFDRYFLSSDELVLHVEDKAT